MVWYTTIIFWLFVVGGGFYILKEIVPKSFWAKLETAIVTWQVNATTGHYEFTQKKTPGKYNKAIFLLLCLGIGLVLSVRINWLVGTGLFLVLYFGIGLILIQRGVIE
jgi:hypothetical protein